MRITKRILRLVLVAIWFATSSCSKSEPIKPLSSAYPVAVDASKVGTYPALTQSGGGYFYDEVLEYRVWTHPTGDDYYHAFAAYEDAKIFSQKNKGAEEPLVLVLQREHVNEPQPGQFEHVKGDRITEWRVEWLKGNKRGPNSISEFIDGKREDAQPEGGGDAEKSRASP